MSPIKATSDVFFKYLFGSETNTDLLVSFINAVLIDSNWEPIVSAEIRNPFCIQEILAEKFSVLDIKAVDQQGRVYDIEMQAAGDKSFANRSLYYWSKLYSSQLMEGDEYTELNPTICINVLNYVMFDKVDRLHTCFMLSENEQPDFILTDHLMIHFLELPKMNIEALQAQLEQSKLLQWLYYLKLEGTEDEKMKILLKDREIAAAHEKYKKFNQDDKIRLAYESRQRWIRDHNSMMKQAEETGMAQGMEKGMEKKSIEIALNLKAIGTPLEVIAQATGLSVDEIELLNKLDAQ